MTDRDVLARLRDAMKAAGSLREFAHRHGISPAYVSKVSRGEQSIGPKIAKALGVRRAEGWTER